MEKIFCKPKSQEDEIDSNIKVLIFCRIRYSITKRKNLLFLLLLNNDLQLWPLFAIFRYEMSHGICDSPQWKFWKKVDLVAYGHVITWPMLGQCYFQRKYCMLNGAHGWMVYHVPYHSADKNASNGSIRYVWVRLFQRVWVHGRHSHMLDNSLIRCPQDNLVRELVNKCGGLCWPDRNSWDHQISFL